MLSKRRKISLIYFVTLTLLLVGLVPLVLTVWLLSERSARELRSVENRYQIQLVQEKARQIEMFGQRYGDLVRGLANALELSGNTAVLSSPATESKLGTALKEYPNLLALYVKPAGAESLSLFRPGMFAAGEIEAIADDASGKLNSQELMIGQPQKISLSGESVMTLASPVIFSGQKAASVVAIVSLKEIAKTVVGTNPTSEDELWKAGLPIIFVVNQNGNAVFHADSSLVDSQRSLTSLKIVTEWQQSNSQIQSGLVPFTAEYDGSSFDMIGAYSTARFGKDVYFGVIAMQDERKALASVGEMRTQTWVISMAFACIALIVGVIAARTLTAPILKLSAAAETLASVDLAHPLAHSNSTEIG